MTATEIAGYCAATLVFCTFYMKTMVPLRIAGIVSNVFFISYGYLVGAYPILILHVLLLPLNVVRLRQMLILVKHVGEATRGDLNMDWLKPFTTTRNVAAGKSVFRRGDPANDMFLIVSGRFRLAEFGIEFPPGSVVGELGLLAPDQSRTATLECLEEGELLQISYDQVKQLYYQNPKFGFFFLQLTTRRLFDNIGKLENELAVCRAASRREPGLANV